MASVDKRVEEADLIVYNTFELMPLVIELVESGNERVEFLIDTICNGLREAVELLGDYNADPTDENVSFEEMNRLHRLTGKSFEEISDFMGYGSVECASKRA